MKTFLFLRTRISLIKQSCSSFVAAFQLPERYIVKNGKPDKIAPKCVRKKGVMQRITFQGLIRKEIKAMFA